MNEPIGSGAIEALFKILVVASLLIVFWIFEVIWRNERKGLLFILIFPPALIYYIIKYWIDTRSKLFFAGLLILMIVLIGSVTEYDFLSRIAALYQISLFWPYYLWQSFKT